MTIYRCIYSHEIYVEIQYMRICILFYYSIHVYVQRAYARSMSKVLKNPCLKTETIKPSRISNTHHPGIGTFPSLARRI